MTIRCQSPRQFVRRLRCRRFTAAIVLVLGFMMVVSPDQASAHAAFDRSDPEPNAILPESPQSIDVWFTEPLEFDFSDAVLFDQRGELVEGVETGPGDDRFSLRIALSSPLERGTYAVAWNNLSAADGHTQRGYFAFTVGTGADVAAVAPPVVAEHGAPLWLQSAARWMVLLGISPLIASVLIWLLVMLPASAGVAGVREALRSRFWSILIVSFLVAMMGNLLALGVQASMLTRGSFARRVGDTLFDTRFGELWMLRIALLIVLALVLSTLSWLEPRRRVALTGVAVVATLLLPLPISLNSHASAVNPGRTTAMFFDWTHILGAGIWFGGLVLLAGSLIWRRGIAGESRKSLLAGALPRFSAIALVCWGMLVITGFYASWLHVGSLDALRETDYGRALTVKLIGVVGVLCLAAINLLLISPRLVKPPQHSEPSPAWTRRLTAAVSVEIVLTLLILFMVGRMTSLQPARDARAAEAGASSIELLLDEQPATLSLHPGSAGPNHFQLLISGETLSENTEAVMRLSHADGALGQSEVRLERTQGNMFEWVGSEMGIAGEWDVEVIVREIGSFSWEGDATVALPEAAAEAPAPPWRFTTHSIAGLLLFGVGLTGLVIAWRAGPTRLRTESAGLGILAIVLGLGIMATDRVTPSAADTAVAAVNPIPAMEDSLIRGQSVYQNLCLSCHGVAGQGDGPQAAGMLPPPSAFTAPHTFLHSDREWYGTISEGVPGTSMSGFGDQLSDVDIWNVVNYIQTEFQGRPVVPDSASTSSSEDIGAVDAGSATPAASPVPSPLATPEADEDAHDMSGMDHVSMTTTSATAAGE